MIFLYASIMTIFLAGTCICDIFYKKKIETIYGKEKKIRALLSGFAYWIFCLMQKVKIIHNDSTKKAVELLYPSENVNQYSTYIIIDRIWWMLMGIVGFSMLGMINELEHLDNSKEMGIVTVNFEEPGQGSSDKQIYAKVNDIWEKWNVSIPEKSLTQQEVENLFDECEQVLDEEILGDNQWNREMGSPQIISKDLNLSRTSYGGLVIEYLVEPEECIGANGEIQWDYIFQEMDKKGENQINVKIRISMNYADYTQEYIKNFIITKDIEKYHEYLMQQQINEEGKKENNQFTLPTNIDGNNIEYKNGSKEENKGATYFVLGIISAICLYAARKKEIKSKLEERRNQLETDYSTVVSKLTLLCQAGSTISNAWNQIVNDYLNNKSIIGRRYVYEEMLIALYQLKSGVSEREVYESFGRRCELPIYIKFGCLLEQNVMKGTKGLKELLEQEVRESFANRKLLAKKRGEEASTKLLLPMAAMLIITMAIVVVPAFLSIGM